MAKEEAIEAIKGAIKKTYGKRGAAVVQKNYAAVDAALANLFARRLWQMMALAALFCAILTTGGLALSYGPDLPAGTRITAKTDSASVMLCASVNEVIVQISMRRPGTSSSRANTTANMISGI